MLCSAISGREPISFTLTNNDNYAFDCAMRIVNCSIGFQGYNILMKSSKCHWEHVSVLMFVLYTKKGQRRRLYTKHRGKANIATDCPL